jgi:hypothetical protein
MSYRSVRTSSPTRDPTLVPQPQRIDPTGYTEFKDWLNRAGVEQIDKYYREILKPEYDTLDLPDTYGNIQNYTSIMNSIQAIQTGFMNRINRINPFARKPDLDLEPLRATIRGTVDQINEARAIRLQQQRSSSAQSASEPMITVPKELYDSIRKERDECWQREYNKTTAWSVITQEMVDGALADYERLKQEGLRITRNGGDSSNTDAARDEAYKKWMNLQKRFEAQNQKDPSKQYKTERNGLKGGRSKRVKRSKRSKRSKRVKRYKRSSTKRH